MDFKFRAIDDEPPSNHLPTPSSSSDPLPGQGLRPNCRPDPVTRELEKARIREEIIASEIARRRALEAEVRRELIAKWDWEMEAMHRARLTGLLSNDQSLTMRLYPSLPLLHHFNNNHRWRPGARFDLFSPPSQPTLPPLSLMLPSLVTEVLNTEVQDSSEAKNDKLIVLAKPDPERVLGAKRKTPPPAETSELPLPSIGSKVKLPDAWSCSICQINVTSEKVLATHLGGKKHKANEARQNSQRMENNSNTSTSPNTITFHEKLRESDQKLEGEETIKNEKVEPLIKREEKDERFMKKNSEDSLEKKDELTVMDMVEVTRKLGKKKKFKFWCDICLVGVHSEEVMETHKKGKKHNARLKGLDKNNVASLATATTDTVTEEPPKVRKS